MEGRLPEGWDRDIPVFVPEDGGMATRQASGKVLGAIAPHIPTLIGGSADLAPSTNTVMKGQGDFARDSYAGRNVHWGVREHAMGAALNGMALHGGLYPYGATFLIFSDYMRPAIRLACLMKQHVIYVLTHDSIGLGEDGPTHQPIETLSTLRAIPNMTTVRPADANETAGAWRLALTHRGGPVALALTRQKVPSLHGTAGAPIERGAYVLADAVDGAPDIILLASGSELQLIVRAREHLAARGIQARVVSVPSLDLFLHQPVGYREQVLPPARRARLAVEAAAPQSWYQLVGLDGDVIGLTHFGASAPEKVLFAQFGFTVENVVRRALTLLGKE
jgi:transketolase